MTALDEQKSGHTQCTSQRGSSCTGTSTIRRRRSLLTTNNSRLGLAEDGGLASSSPESGVGSADSGDERRSRGRSAADLQRLASGIGQGLGLLLRVGGGSGVGSGVSRRGPGQLGVGGSRCVSGSSGSLVGRGRNSLVGRRRRGLVGGGSHFGRHNRGSSGRDTSTGRFAAEVVHVVNSISGISGGAGLTGAVSDARGELRVSARELSLNTVDAALQARRPLGIDSHEAGASGDEAKSELHLEGI